MASRKCSADSNYRTPSSEYACPWHPLTSLRGTGWLSLATPVRDFCPSPALLQIGGGVHRGAGCTWPGGAAHKGRRYTRFVSALMLLKGAFEALAGVVRQARRSRSLMFGRFVGDAA